METKAEAEVLLSVPSSLSQSLTSYLVLWSSPLTVLIFCCFSCSGHRFMLHLEVTHSSVIHPLILFHFMLLSFICWDYDCLCEKPQQQWLTSPARKELRTTISMELFISDLLTLSMAIGWHSARFRTAKLAIYLKASFPLDSVVLWQTQTTGLLISQCEGCGLLIHVH